MSDAEPQSPRTAIRKWLQVADSRSTAKPDGEIPGPQAIERRSRRHHTGRHSLENKTQHDKKASRRHQRHNKSQSRQRRVAEIDLLNTHREQPQMHLEEKAAVNPNESGLAERLGLHAPFRTFKDHSENDCLDIQDRPRKRRRSRSSTDSDLQPAAATDLSDNSHDRSKYAKVPRTANRKPALVDRGNQDSPAASQSSERTLPSPEMLLNPYERRPRQKTRQDRYELKDRKTGSKKTKRAAKKDCMEKKQKKHKRKEKSGATLMHDFTARNVAHDRLTVSCI